LKSLNTGGFGSPAVSAEKRTLEPEIIQDSDREMTQESPDLRRNSLTGPLNTPPDNSMLTSSSPNNVRFDSRKIDSVISPNTNSPKTLNNDDKNQIK